MAVYIDKCLWATGFGTPPHLAHLMVARSESYVLVGIPIRWCGRDGEIAFAWNGEKQDNRDIYVRLVDTGRPLRQQ
jgi:hypothetical protein